jgi:hypothetical protein
VWSRVEQVTWMPKCFSIVFLISSDPHTMQGVVPHNYEDKDKGNKKKRGKVRAREVK